MLRQEFTSRTGYNPSYEEYMDIENEYHVFPGDKDKFCKAWKRVNKAKILRQKEEERQREERIDKESKLYALYHFLGRMGEYSDRIRQEWISDEEDALCHEFGITIAYMSWSTLVGDVRYAISRLLGSKWGF